MSVSVNGGSSAFADAPPAASCVRVVVRLRPLSPKEALDGAQVCVSVVDADTTTAAPPTTVCVRGADPACLPGHPAANKVFVFDRVFAPDASQEAIYAHSVRPLVDSFLTGFNVTTLAYGQTGSGKTWTMGTGLGNAVLPSENVGIVPRAIKDIFGFLETKKSTLGDKFYFSVHVSFLELYNEDIIDLLNPRPRTAQSSSSATAPTIREDSHGQIVWINVREEPVSTPDELLNCLQRGSLCRSTGSTDMNASSSRSHAIFSIILKQQISSAAPTAETRPSTEVNYSGEDSLQVDLQSESVSLTETWATLISKFHFVDLAGSERLKRTNAEGDRKREGISINQGLLALGNVISALGDEAKKSSHVPYRDSKLTRMLQDSLGGNSQTLMIACASPSESSYGETVSTLTYANRARNIKNKAVVNREFAASGANAAAEKEIRALRTLVADLRDEIVALRSGSSAAHIPAIADISLAAESSVLNNDYFSSAITAHERDYQLHLQGERELATMLETVRAELRTSRFDCDRFGFKCSRLMDRMNSVLEELNSVKIERDAASVELEQWRSGKLRLEKVGVQSSVASIKAESAGSNTDEGMDRSVITKMIADYNNTISDLKFRLSETSDRLAWYNEVVSTFSSEESRREKILATFNSLPENTNEVPTPRSIRTIKAHENPSHEVLEERKLWKALEVDADLKQVLGPESETRTSSDVVSDAPKARLFGIPKEATNTFAPSQLSVNSEGVQWNEDDEYDDMEVDMDMDDPYHDESPHLGEVAIPMKESTTSANETLASNEKILPPAVADRSSDIYMLIHRLQADIAQHQALIDKQTKREQAYQAFREAYEAKLNGLQSQLAAVGRERDEALKKIRSGGGGNGKDRPGTAAIKQKFDEQKRKLEMQIAEFKKKMAEKAKDNAQSKNDVLTKQLMQTIDALKGMWFDLIFKQSECFFVTAEKFRAMKELKKESMKIRDMKTAKEREIARLRKREKVATELAKKLERSNQLQKIILKRRSDEAMQSHSKLKTVMALLKKSGSSQRFKAGVMSPSKSSLPSSAGRFSNRILGSICEDEALLKSMKFGSLQTGSDNPPLAIHSKFKKQMIDKELSTTVAFRIAELELGVLNTARERLLDEQRELLSERERCVAADAEISGIWDAQKPQYMDDRLGVIDMEVAMLNAKIRNLQSEIKLGKAASALTAAINTNADGECRIQNDIGWENAVNLLRSLDVFEQEYVAILLLEDIVENRIAVKGLEAKLADTEKTVADLRASLSTMRGAALQTAMEYRKEMDNLRNMAADKIASAVASENCSQAKETQRDPNFSRSKSSLFSFDEYGAATPKLQKMFDSAYGRGFVVLKPSLRRVMSGFVEPVAAEEVVRGAEEALRKEVTTGDDVADEESSDGHSRQTSPIRKSLSVDKLVLNSSKLEGRSGGKYSPELYQVEPNGLEVDLSAESQSSDFESSGRGRTILLQSPIKALRAASVPPSPLVAGSDKAIIHNFINLRRRKISIKPAEDSLDSRIPPETTSAAVVGLTDGNIEENNGQFKKIQNHHGGLRPLTVPNMRLYDYDDSLPESGEHKKIVKATDGSTIDSLSGGGDVFSRLATSHTLASQAKVIHREKEVAEGHNVDGSVQRKLSIVNSGATGAK